MIEAKNVSAGYDGRPVISGVSALFRPGQVTGILGPNGCGKSTFLGILSGALRPMEGEILLEGEPMDAMTPREIARRVACLAQGRNVPDMEARALVLHGRFPYLSYPRRYRPEDHERAKLAMEETGCYELRHKLLRELSGGERQKVYMAMVLAQDTGTVLMDEPTTYLDVRNQLETIKMVKRLARAGKTVVMVLHDIEAVLQSCDQVLLFSKGRLTASGTPEEVGASGELERAFGVELRRVRTEDGDMVCRPRLPEEE